MRQFNKITIIGVGLIGGSIGLAIKKRKLAREVVGVFRHRSTLKRALKAKAINRGTLDLVDGVKGADLVILATPVKSIPRITEKIIKYLRPGTIITDVGSTKKWIVDNIEKKLARHGSIHFIGSHPMAGSEHAGVEFAKADLLEGSPCIVARTSKSGRLALTKVSNFWRSLGAKVKIMDPVSHDVSVALISHLPHIVAFSLVSAVPQDQITYAAEGFKDTTRVAASDPELWADIFLTNRKEILRSGRLFEKHYKSLLKIIAAGKHQGLIEFLKKAKQKRDKLVYGKEA